MFFSISPHLAVASAVATTKHVNVPKDVFLFGTTQETYDVTSQPIYIEGKKNYQCVYTTEDGDAFSDKNCLITDRITFDEKKQYEFTADTEHEEGLSDLTKEELSADEKNFKLKVSQEFASKINWKKIKSFEDSIEIRALTGEEDEQTFATFGLLFGNDQDDKKIGSSSEIVGQSSDIFFNKKSVDRVKLIQTKRGRIFAKCGFIDELEKIPKELFFCNLVPFTWDEQKEGSFYKDYEFKYDNTPISILNKDFFWRVQFKSRSGIDKNIDIKPYQDKTFVYFESKVVHTSKKVNAYLSGWHFMSSVKLQKTPSQKYGASILT